MAIKFHNIKSGEDRLCETPEMIAAHLNSGDRSPNAHTGQDAGWRLAPETVVQLEEYSKNEAIVQRVASISNKPLDGVTEYDILAYISSQNNKSHTGEQAQSSDFERKYEDDLRRLRQDDANRDAQIVRDAEKNGTPVPERISKGQALSTNTEADNGNIDEEPDAPVDISTLKRPQLNEYAESVGIENPEKVGNIPELLEAIKLKESEEV